MKKIIGIKEKLPLFKTLPLSFQHLFAMFGATILVPLLFGVNPAIALLMNGIGTIIYSFVTKGGIPAYLGSSFAFIAPTTVIIKHYGGFHHAQLGYLAFGLFFILISFIIRKFGTKWIHIIMPKAVMGAVVAVIGLELAPVAADESGLLASTPDYKILIVSLGTLFIGVMGSVIFRGFFKVIPILIAVIGGYILACFFGMIQFNEVIKASWFQIPHLSKPTFDKRSFEAIFVIFPAFIVVLAEHVGHLIVTGNITENDLLEKPGLHRSLLGDGLANILSGFVGSPPNTTYGENIGVMAITRVYSVWVIRCAAMIAILLSCIGKVPAFIHSIPDPVIGGMSLLLYGTIATSGIRMLVEKQVDFSKSYHLVLASITFIIGVSGAAIQIGTIQFKGMSLAAITGMILSIIFYLLSKIGLMNEEYEF